MPKNKGLVLIAAVVLLLSPPSQGDAALDERVELVLSDTPLVDGHNDFPRFRERFADENGFEYFNSDLSGLDRPPHTDIPRLQQGRVGAQFWSAYHSIEEQGVSEIDTDNFLAQMDFIYQFVEGNPKYLEMAYSADDIVRVNQANKIACLIGIEGGHAIQDSLASLRMLYRAGARYMTLTHSKGLSWIDSAQDEQRIEGGLTAHGRSIIREMNRLGMMIDLSHVAPASMHAVLDESEDGGVHMAVSADQFRAIFFQSYKCNRLIFFRVLIQSTK